MEASAELRDSCKKRVREEDEYHHMNCAHEKHAKINRDDDRKNEVLENNKCNNHNSGGSSSSIIETVNNSSSCKTWPSSEDWQHDDYCDLSFGVFDFPWLKDGVISKAEQEYYWNFEDYMFSSALVNDHEIHVHTPRSVAPPKPNHHEFSNFSWQCFYDDDDENDHRDKEIERSENNRH